MGATANSAGSGMESCADVASAATEMSVNITNALGQTVKQVNTGNLNAGQHNFSVNTADLAAGMYFINFTDGANVVTQRFVVAN